MLQRIQTLFLLLAIILLGLFLWLPVLAVEAPKVNSSLQGYDITHTMRFMEQPYVYYFNAIFIGTAIAFSLINIFLFKKRGLQMLLCWFSVLLIASGEIFVYYKYQIMVFDGDVILTYWNLLPLAAIALHILAIVFIRKDEALLASVDRLRD